MSFKSSQLFVFLVVAVFLLSFNIDSYYSTPIPRSATFSGDGTFYEVGLGACGQTNSDSQLVCALSFTQFDPSPNGNPNLNPNCGRQIQISSGGKSVVCTIVDRCQGCAFGSVDMSPAAFDKLANPSAGRIPITWNFI